MKVAGHCEAVRIGPLALPADLEIPEHARGLVIFAHGRGSTRHSPRNRWVAGALHGHRLATLLFDLQGDDRADDPRRVFDIALSSERVEQALDWARQHPALAGLGVGVFAAGTGAAAALCAAARRPAKVGAIVSRGGRPDLAADCLAQVGAPTLLIVGGADREVLDLNRHALRGLHCTKRLEVVPGATHLFEEPGKLASVAALAGGWFEIHLARPWLAT